MRLEARKKAMDLAIAVKKKRLQLLTEEVNQKEAANWARYNALMPEQKTELERRGINPPPMPSR